MENQENSKEQETLFKLRAYEQQIGYIQQQINAVENGISELISLNEGIEKLLNSKDKEIFAPIGRGIFIKSKILSEELLVDVGNKNLVKKTIPETQNLIKKQTEKLEEIKKELDMSIEKLVKEVEKMVGEEKLA